MSHTPHILCQSLITPLLLLPHLCPIPASKPPPLPALGPSPSVEGNESYKTSCFPLERFSGLDVLWSHWGTSQDTNAQSNPETLMSLIWVVCAVWTFQSSPGGINVQPGLRITSLEPRKPDCQHLRNHPLALYTTHDSKGFSSIAIGSSGWAPVFQDHDHL